MSWGGRVCADTQPKGMPMPMGVAKVVLPRDFYT